MNNYNSPNSLNSQPNLPPFKNCWLRVLKHLLIPNWWYTRKFTTKVMQNIESAITTFEKKHRGEIRFIVEGNLPLTAISQSPRQRACWLFATNGVWDTQDSTGILIYVLLADRQMEIMADRGISKSVLQSTWENICTNMENHYSRGEWELGSIGAINEISELLSEYFPANATNPNELPNNVIKL